MKILVINGSPKGEHSDTMVLTRAFLEGLGESAETIDTMALAVKPCLGCYACWRKTPGKCVQDDGMQAVLDKICEADLIIWSTPLYCYSFPSNLKAVIDRLLPLSTPLQRVNENGVTYHPSRMKNDVKMLLVSGCGFPDIKGNYDALIWQSERLFDGKLPMILCCEAPLLNIESAKPATAPYLRMVCEAGAEYKRTGTLSEETENKLQAPMYPPELYRKSAGGES